MLVKYKRKKGISLPEILVYMSLMGVIFTGVFGVLISGIKYHNQARNMADIYTNALFALSGVTADVSESDNSKIIKDTGTSNWIMFASPKNVSTGSFTFDSSGDVYWQKWVAYYLETQPGGSKNLVKKEFTISPAIAGSPGNPPYTSKAQIESAVASRKKTIARGVSKFEVKTGDTSNSYIIAITVERTTDMTKPNNVTAETEVFVRN